MTSAEAEMVERIAVALERQVAQVDEQMARNAAMRDENVRRHDRERDEELRAAKASTREFVAKMDEMIAVAVRRAIAPTQDADAVGEAHE